MSYNFLVNATKNRVITELREAFSKIHHLKDLQILNKFPYEERIQEGIIIRNSSASRMALSADNFQGTVSSYVTLARHSNNLSKSIEWVREDDSHLSEYVVREDFSGQFVVFPQKNTIIQINGSFLKGQKDLSFADSYKNVEVFVNNQKVIPSFVDGENGQIYLSKAPPAYSSVEVSYWTRNLVSSGVYQIEITGGDPNLKKFEFMVDPLLDQSDVLIEKVNGDETSVRLSRYPIYKGSLKLRENRTLLIKGTDYEVDESTGIITLMTNLLQKSKLTAEYRIQGLSTGPYEIPGPNCANNKALPGIVLAFGRNVSVGDKHFVIVNPTRMITAQEFSGKWDMGISLEVYAKDSHKIEEIIDEATSNLLFFKKSELDSEGIALVDVSIGGEAKQFMMRVLEIYITQGLWNILF